MFGKSGRQVFDFYLKANANKEKLLNGYESTRPYSVAEDTVMSCLDVLLLNEPDASNKIRYILLSSLEDKLDGLEKKDDYLSFLSENFKGPRPIRYPRAYNEYSKRCKETKQTYNNYLKLRNLIRQGHIYWGAKGDRLESVLEHIYGCLVLTLGIESEYGYIVDYDRILKMLLLHETEEIKIKDLTEWDISKEEKAKRGKLAINELLSGIDGGDKLIELIDEFNKRNTLESEYANLIDKLEYDMQVKVYELQGRYDYANYPDNVVTRSPRVQEIINNGATSVFDVHYEYDKDRYYSIPCLRRVLEETKKY